MTHARGKTSLRAFATRCRTLSSLVPDFTLKSSNASPRKHPDGEPATLRTIAPFQGAIAAVMR
jgi:hypothetical protein